MAVACLQVEPQWFALKVRSRAEKLAETFLSTRGFDTLCPTYTDVRQYSDRRKKVPAPLFPGYLFCKLNWNHRLPVLTAPHVEYVVGFGHEPTPVPESEIQAVQAIVRSGVRCEPHPFLKIGQRVRVASGPLADLEGILIGTRGANRVVVSVGLLQRSVAAEIEGLHLRPV